MRLPKSTTAPLAESALCAVDFFFFWQQNMIWLLLSTGGGVMVAAAWLRFLRWGCSCAAVAVGVMVVGGGAVVDGQRSYGCGGVVALLTVGCSCAAGG